MSINDIASMISEDIDTNYAGYRKAIAVVFNDDGEILIGLATNPDRKGKWCFPGGRIEKGEDPVSAAIRECEEETGIVCVQDEFGYGSIRVPENSETLFVFCLKVSGIIFSQNASLL